MNASPSCTSLASFPNASAIFVLCVTMKVLVWAFGVAFTNSRGVSHRSSASCAAVRQCIDGSHVFVGEQFAGFNRPIEPARVGLVDWNAELFERSADLAGHIPPLLAQLPLGFHVVKIKRIDIFLAVVSGDMTEYDDVTPLLQRRYKFSRIFRGYLGTTE